MWSNGADGKTFSATVWPDGDKTQEGIETDGDIVGLPAGDYLVRETGNVPAGYARAKDVPFQLNDDGTATATNGVSNTTDKDGAKVVNVTVDDPILRGHLELTKYVSIDGSDTNRTPLKGATFDLYSTEFDDPIAIGLTSDANGKVATNSSANKGISLSAGFVTEHDGRYLKLGDGLPEGTYYFVETNATADAVTPSGDEAKSRQLTITQNDHFAHTSKFVTTTMDNVDFNADVTLAKMDASNNNAPLSGATFHLYYRPEGSTATNYPEDLRTKTTGADGTVTFSDLSKGDYQIVEEGNAGYEGSFSATFTITNDDQGQTLDLAKNRDRFTLGSGVTLTEDNAVPNTRKTGTVTLNKTGAGSPIDATFDLQVKRGDDWETVATGLSTSHNYELTWSADGLTATATETGTLAAGALTVSGLTWQTYQFVETGTADGFLPADEDGALTSGEFEITRDNVSAGVTLNMTNEQTDLQINKRDTADKALSGATFTVTGVDGTTFADGTTQKEIVTNGSGLARLTGQLVVGGTYAIQETSAPAQYDLLEGVSR